MERELTSANRPSLVIPNSSLLISHQNLPINYIRKRSPKFLDGKILCHTAEFNLQQEYFFPAVKRVQRIKHPQALQSVIYQNQYLFLLKKHRLSIQTHKAHQTEEKNHHRMRYIFQKLRKLKRYSINLNHAFSKPMRFFATLTSLSIQIQGSHPCYKKYLVLDTLDKHAKRLRSLTSIYITVEETSQDLRAMKRLLELTKKMPSVKEIHLKYMYYSYKKHENFNLLDLGTVEYEKIITLESIPHPIFLVNTLTSSRLFLNLHRLVLQVPLLSDLRFREFDFAALQKLNEFNMLQTLDIRFELCDAYFDIFTENLRFPQNLKKLGLSVENLNFKLLAEKNKASVKAFFKDFAQLSLEELQLDISVSNSFCPTYCRFLRPLILSQKALKTLGIQYKFAAIIQKLAEKNFLHIHEIYQDIQTVGTLENLHANFEILDYSQRTPNRGMFHENLKYVALYVQEVMGQETPMRGFIEENLVCLMQCKKLQDLTLSSPGYKATENVKNSLKILKKFENMKRVYIEWNTDALEMELLVNYLERIKKTTKLYFGFKQLLFNKNELDCISKTIQRSKSLSDVKICGICVDIMKHGLYGEVITEGSKLNCF